MAPAMGITLRDDITALSVDPSKVEYPIKSAEVRPDDDALKNLFADMYTKQAGLAGAVKAAQSTRHADGTPKTLEEVQEDGTVDKANKALNESRLALAAGRTVRRMLTGPNGN